MNPKNLRAAPYLCIARLPVCHIKKGSTWLPLKE